MNLGCVIITGACGGIGSELVRAYRTEGYRVIAVDLKEVSIFPQDVEYLSLDISRIVEDLQARTDLKSAITKQIGDDRLCGLINNAAVQIVKRVEDIQTEDWSLTLNTNLLAPFFISQMFLDNLESGGGSIVNISSVHARQTKKNFTVYATSKAGLSSLTRLMAIELGDRIRVNAIEPGAISTQMLEDGFRTQPEKRILLDELHPMGRIGEPSEVAQLALFLTSSKAEFINGATIAIDGGIRNQLHDPI
jgi:NAD(P)-dependent dehydrogenase (short-subunit alcohol dehydrogenase family)